jgi:hypothetical protein
MARQDATAATPWWRRRVAVVTPLVVGLTGCGASPSDPGRGELTAVVVSRQDQFMFGLGSGVSDVYTRVAVLSEQDLLDWYAATWPGRERPAASDYRNVVVKIPLETLTPVADAGAADDRPAVAEVDAGRVRIPWSGAPRYLCFGTEHDAEITTDGCVAVDRQPPAAVTVQLNYGGLALEE